jgi:GNAT superfamily N-acetyltransferase
VAALAWVRIFSVRIDVVPYDHPDAVPLIAEVQQEYVVRYGDVDLTPVDPAQFAPPRGLFLVAYLDARPVACGGWRVHDGPDGPEAELKRMYVSPVARGRGVARAVLADLERTAVEAGYPRMVLETGLRQPEAISLYRACGYAEVPKFGYYANEPSAVHLGKILKEQRCPSTR